MSVLSFGWFRRKPRLLSVGKDFAVVISYAGIIRIRSTGMISARPAAQETSTPKQYIYYTPCAAKNQAGFVQFRASAPAEKRTVRMVLKRTGRTGNGSF